MTAALTHHIGFHAPEAALAALVLAVIAGGALALWFASARVRERRTG